MPQSIAKTSGVPRHAGRFAVIVDSAIGCSSHRHRMSPSSVRTIATRRLYLSCMSGDLTSAIPHCLHTDICPNCAYSLAGLPDSGLCPECGRAYDQSEIMLYGWARGQRENLATARGSRLVWVFLVSIV